MRNKYVHVKRLLEVSGGDLEVIVGVLGGRVGVCGAGVVFDELHENVLARVLLGAHEEHVLAEVRQARERLRIEHVAGVDVDGRCRSVGQRITDQQTLHAVVEQKAAIETLVLARLLDALVDAHSLAARRRRVQLHRLHCGSSRDRLLLEDAGE